MVTLLNAWGNVTQNLNYFIYSYDRDLHFIYPLGSLILKRIYRTCTGQARRQCLLWMISPMIKIQVNLDDHKSKNNPENWVENPPKANIPWKTKCGNPMAKKSFHHSMEAAVLIIVKKIEKPACVSLIHIYTNCGPMLGAKCCIDMGQHDRGTRLCFFNSYIHHLRPHVGRQMLYRYGST